MGRNIAANFRNCFRQTFWVLGVCASAANIRVVSILEVLRLRPVFVVRFENSHSTKLTRKNTDKGNQMTKSLKYVPFVFALALCLSGLAFADPGKGNGIGEGHGKGNPHNQAPEIDPSLALGAFALFSGTLAVQRSRRSR
jgi:hypothetical protein